MSEVQAPLAERLKDVHYFEMPQWAHEAVDEAITALATNNADEVTEAMIEAGRQVLDRFDAPSIRPSDPDARDLLRAIYLDMTAQQGGGK